MSRIVNLSEINNGSSLVGAADAAMYVNLVRFLVMNLAYLQLLGPRG